MKNAQQKLFHESPQARDHGGDQSLGRAKTRRPFLPKKWIHVCLKSDQAKGSLSFLAIKNRIVVETLLKKMMSKYQIESGEFVIMKNHLHLKIKARRREDFAQFLRAFTSQLARLITGARKGRPFGHFWKGLAYSRVLTSAKEELYLRGYFQGNRVEAKYGYAAREAFLANLNRG